MRLLTTVVAAASIILGSYAWAKEEQSKASSIHEFKLSNGLTLLVKENHRAPVLISQVWYKVGSSYEPNGITGISHALEHMMFKGTPTNPGASFFDKIAQVGGEQNAFTSYDFTGYWQKLIKDQLPLSFELEADRMQNLLLPPEEFAKEIEVVKEERHLSTDNDPQSLTFERFAAAAYISSPYHHPVIGWQSDLNNMSVDDLRTWYSTWYTPNNAIIVVIGDVDPQAVYQLAKQYFDKIPARKLPVVKAYQEVPSLGARLVKVKAPAKLPYLLMGYNTPSVKTTQVDWEPYALEVLASILSGNDSARFPKNLVRGQEVASYAGASFDLYSRLSGLFTIDAMPAEKHTIAEVEKAILEQIADIQNKPITAKELDRIKAQTIANKIYAQDSLVNQALFLGSLLSIGLPWQEMDSYPEKIKNITAEQVQTVAKKYLTAENLTTALLEPEPI